MEEILSKSTFGLGKAGIASVATAALVMGAGFAGAGSASALPGFEFSELAGENRYDTAQLVADAYEETNTEVILANGEHGNFADALAANTLAGERDVPILLTRNNFTPQPTLDQLEQDGVETITVVGGTTRVSDEQVAKLREAGYTVNRIAGADRFETNVEIIERSGQAVDNLGVVATGFEFPDALAAGPVTYQGHPLGLSTGTDMDDEVTQALKAAGVNEVLIFGGTDAVGPGVVADLTAAGITVRERFAGADRSETSTLAANWAIDNLAFTNEHVGVASGYIEGSGADALAGGPLEGQETAPMLVTKSDTNPGAVTPFLASHSDTLLTGHIYGGPVAIDADSRAEMEAAAQGDSRAQVSVSSQNVEAGQDITGTITGENIDSASVAGPCVQNGDVQDTDATTSDVEFSIPTNSDAQGSCTLTFTTTFDDGTTETDEATVNVTQPASATARPELRDAEVISTTTSNQATPTNPAGTTVRYTFDEAVIGGTAAPRAAQFHVYDAAGNAVGDGSQTVVSQDGNDVVIRFGAVNTTEQAETLTVATVDVNAVTDQQGDVNPEGDAAIGTSAGGDITLAAGITEAPDLVSVGNFRESATAGETAVDFTFDEAASTTTLDGSGFNLVFVQNPEGAATNDLECTGPTATDTTGGGGTQPGGNDTTTITVLCANPGTSTIAAGDVARGTVDAGSVEDNENNRNVLQAAEVSNGGNTFEPDLVSVRLQPDTDSAVFTFDADVDTANGTLFNVYDDSGNEVAGATADTATVNQQNRQEVLVTFAEGAVDRAVGGNVEDGAVQTAATATTVALTNEQDEVGVENTIAGTSRTPGLTEDPDLTGVALAQPTGTDPFGNPTTGDFQATYTFDEAVTVTPIAGNFFLYQADGTRLVATDCATGDATAEENNTVTCTAYNVAGTSGTAATSEQVGEATLGTVDNGAVTSVDDAGTNPEGAEFTTGGTGTRTR
jgi:putative cell wall-binding protein